MPRTKSLLDARENHRKYLISLNIDPDRKLIKETLELYSKGEIKSVTLKQVEKLIYVHQLDSSNSIKKVDATKHT